MVKMMQWAFGATLALGSTAYCGKAKYNFLPHNAIDCSSPDPYKVKHIKEGECHDSHRWNVLSYQLLEPKHPHRKPNAKQHCKLHFWDNLNCHGYDSWSGNVEDAMGVCQNVNFTTGAAGAGFRGAKSVKLLCKPIPSVKPMKSTRVRTTAYTEVMDIMPLQPAVTTTVWPHLRTTASPCCQQSVHDLQTSRASPSSLVETATVKQTTTIIAPPTATVQGKTTVWIASSTSHAVHEHTYVVTMTDRSELGQKVKEAMSREDASSALATPRPSLVVRAEPNSTECYASIDGRWIVSTCAAPTATQLLERRAACTGHKRWPCAQAL